MIYTTHISRRSSFDVHITTKSIPTINDNVTQALSNNDMEEKILGILQFFPMVGSPDDKFLARSLVNDVTQDAFKAELRKDNKILHLSNDQNKIELNLAEDETYDSDDSNAYVRRRVAELNLELSKEKEYFADNYEKKTGRVNFHPQLFYSRIICQNSCEDLNDFSEDEINELKKLSHNDDDDTMNKSIMNANPKYSQQRTSVIPGPVNISENNLGGYESLISKESNVEEADKNFIDTSVGILSGPAALPLLIYLMAMLISSIVGGPTSIGRSVGAALMLGVFSGAGRFNSSLKCSADLFHLYQQRSIACAGASWGPEPHDMLK
ncbi:unnamed protein product [Schistosoma margrebowiei]|uniref:Uncharacterized protein n=1 Tax=Schistosoma margrebowiei TaxID=48269 RepID=A0A183NAC0_9TREM|nr:unnamed protein product [Schistosoma margrebowiei]